MVTLFHCHKEVTKRRIPEIVCVLIHVSIRLVCLVKFSAEGILKYSYFFIPDNKLQHYLQIVSKGRRQFASYVKAFFYETIRINIIKYCICWIHQGLITNIILISIRPKHSHCTALMKCCTLSWNTFNFDLQVESNVWRPKSYSHLHWPKSPVAEHLFLWSFLISHLNRTK